MRRSIVTFFACVFAVAVLAQDSDKDPAPPEKPEAGKEEAPPPDEIPPDPDDKGRGANSEGWEPYLELLEATHNAPAKEGDKPTVLIKFNLSPDIPKGTKVNFEFEYVGVEFENVDYLLKDENRKGLNFLWKPVKRLGTGEYVLRTRIHLDQQTPAIQKVIGQNEKRFPAKNAPWMWYYFDKPIKVGSPEDEAAEKEAICKAYTEFVDKLVANMVEFVDKMEEVKGGKDFVNGKVLDVAKLKEFVEAWRKKQGEVQQEIVEFPDTEQALFQRSITTYQNLRELGRMVSKRSVQVQKEVTDQYKVQEKINPPGHQFFDFAFKYKVTPDQMNDRMKIISDQVCPKEKEAEVEEGGEDPAGADAKKAKDGEDKATEEPAAEPKETKEGDKSKKTKDKKKSPPAKKTTEK
jgi:hypothetical protein